MPRENFRRELADAQEAVTLLQWVLGEAKDAFDAPENLKRTLWAAEYLTRAIDRHLKAAAAAADSKT